MSRIHEGVISFKTRESIRRRVHVPGQSISRQYVVQLKTTITATVVAALMETGPPVSLPIPRRTSRGLRVRGDVCVRSAARP